ncbi:MAG TPA: SAM-dependent chlorinase/fluorinase [Bryobacteraceae bacterium]|nr:SAM-dependent chlorinase/fluorinase [Bryobacteraceae bacterium]
MRQPIVTLTTDFGLSDHFVGAMKGVILSLEPRARIVDISHTVTPYSIAEAAFVLWQAYACFPRGTVHVVVVDPGVGSARRALLVEAAGQYFLAPDNGVLSMILAREKHKVRAITAERYFRRPVSRTFHGRDIFAPVAAHLARGVAPARFGRLISDYARGEFAKPVPAGESGWKGTVLKADRFGNLITNFPSEGHAGLRTGEFEMRAGRRRITRCVSSYSEGRRGELIVIAGSSELLEIAVNQGSAAKLTGLAAGSPVQLRLAPAYTVGNGDNTPTKEDNR